MTKIYLQKSGQYEETRPPSTNDDWDRGDSHTTWDFGEASLAAESVWRETFDAPFDIAPGDEVHIVVAVWSTGDSFGHDSQAESEIFGVHKTLVEAEDHKRSLEHGSHIKHLPWDGYFESLDYITIESRIVQDGTKSA